MKNEIEDLTTEMEQLDRDRKECEAAIKSLFDQEDPAAGKVFAQEIFQRQRDKLRLQVEMEFRRKRIARLKLGIDTPSQKY